MLSLAITMNLRTHLLMQNSAYEPCANQAWQLHPANITIKRVVLVALHHISEGSWQAEVLVDV